MSELWRLIQAHMDAQKYPPSERQVARALGVSPTTIRNWKDARGLPSRENLQGIAHLTGVPYSVVLDAALIDSGYREAGEDGGHTAASTVPGMTRAQWDQRRLALMRDPFRPLSEREVLDAIGPRPSGESAEPGRGKSAGGAGSTRVGHG